MWSQGKRKKKLTKSVFDEMGNGNMGDKPEYNMYPPKEASAEYMARRRKLGFDMYNLMGIARDDKMGRLKAMQDNFEFFQAPVGIIITVDRFVDRNGWGHVGMFLQSLCLLAVEAGLATCLQEAWSQFHQSVLQKHSRY